MAAGVDLEELADRDLGVDGRRFQLFVAEELLYQRTRNTDPLTDV
jgi:hypothetical protein